MKAMILAAGFGKRLGELTKSKPLGHEGGNWGEWGALGSHWGQPDIRCQVHARRWVMPSSTVAAPVKINPSPDGSHKGPNRGPKGPKGLNRGPKGPKGGPKGPKGLGP